MGIGQSLKDFKVDFIFAKSILALENGLYGRRVDVEKQLRGYCRSSGER